MNQDRLQGLWKQFRGLVKERWGKITGDPQVAAAGTRDRHIGGIQERRGIRKREEDRQIAEFMGRHRNWRNPSSR